MSPLQANSEGGLIDCPSSLSSVFFCQISCCCVKHSRTPIIFFCFLLSRRRERLRVVPSTLPICDFKLKSIVKSVSLNNGSVSRVAIVWSSTSEWHLRASTEIAFLVVLKKIERVFVSNERQCDANQYTVHAALFLFLFLF